MAKEVIVPVSREETELLLDETIIKTAFNDIFAKASNDTSDSNDTTT